MPDMSADRHPVRCGRSRADAGIGVVGVRGTDGLYDPDDDAPPSNEEPDRAVSYYRGMDPIKIQQYLFRPLVAVPLFLLAAGICHGLFGTPAWPFYVVSIAVLLWRIATGGTWIQERERGLRQDTSGRWFHRGPCSKCGYSEGERS